MHIEPLDRKTIKIVLSQNDMREMSVTYEQMDYNRPETKTMVLHLLEEVRKKTKLDFTAGKLFIEAFPSRDGGCILYLNLLREKLQNTTTEKEFMAPILFTLPNVKQLRQTCKKLFLHYHHLISKSSLYFWEEKYVLILYSYYKLDKKMIALIKEHGIFFGKGEIKYCFIKEHGKLLIKDTAIETITKYIG